VLHQQLEAADVAVKVAVEDKKRSLERATVGRPCPPCRR